MPPTLLEARAVLPLVRPPCDPLESHRSVTIPNYRQPKWSHTPRVATTLWTCWPVAYSPTNVVYMLCWRGSGWIDVDNIYPPSGHLHSRRPVFFSSMTTLAHARVNDWHVAITDMVRSVTLDWLVSVTVIQLLARVGTLLWGVFVASVTDNSTCIMSLIITEPVITQLFWPHDARQSQHIGIRARRLHD